MKETSFIDQNKKKWARFEKLRNNKSNDPDEVSELFTEITEDLSYARTFYPRRSVKVYLNQLAGGVFTSLYKQRRQPLTGFVKFWTETVPLEVYRSRFNLLTALLFFLVAIVIGAVSQHYDVDFVRIILGDGYVEQTEVRIQNRNPMGIYGESGQASMFFAITINNIRVAFLVFVTGILFNVVTYFLLLYNGVMLGAFQWWFKSKGLLLTSFLAIWIHGAFEISAIVIAGGAGLTVGNGFFFPRSYTRIQSLVFAAKRGLVIMLSLIPFFIIAGFLESFVTRYYLQLADITKWAIILLSFAIVFLYYGVYPFIVARKKPELIFAIICWPFLLVRYYLNGKESNDKIELKEIPRHIPERKIEHFKIRSIGEIFTDTFYLFVNNFSALFRKISAYVIPLLVIMTGLVYYIDYSRFNYIHLTWWETFGTLFGTGSDFYLWKILGWSLPIALMILFGLTECYKKNFKLSNQEKFFAFLSLYLFTLSTMFILLSAPGPLMFILITATPFFCLIPPIIVFEKKNFFSAWGRCFKLIKNSFGDGIGSFAAFFLIAVIFFMILANPFDLGLTSLVEELVRMLTISEVYDYAVVISIVNTTLYMIYIVFMIILYSLSFSFIYFNAHEKESAVGLYDRLEKFGKRSRTLEKELDFE